MGEWVLREGDYVLFEKGGKTETNKKGRKV